MSGNVDMDGGLPTVQVRMQITDNVRAETGVVLIDEFCQWAARQGGSVWSASGGYAERAKEFMTEWARTGACPR